MRELLLILAAACLYGAADLKTGAPAPPLTLNQLLQAPSGTEVTWNALKGSAVVLEFWATWCGGCRQQIPHLNRLEEQFRGKPLRFISLTDEEPGIVQRFLKDYPIAGWVGLDSDERTFKGYGINGRPTTVLVDAAGMVRGIGNASDLTGDMLENLLAGKPVAFSMDAASAAKLQSLPEPFYEATIRPAAPVDVTGFSSGAVSGKQGKRWEAWGVALVRLLSDVYGVPEKRIEAPAWAAWAGRDRYDVALAAPELTDTRRLELLQRALEVTFQLKAHKESRGTDVYVLRRRPGMEPKVRPAASAASSRWGKDGDITAVSMTLRSVAMLAGQALGKTVVDETGLTGRFDFELKWDAAAPQSLIEAVRTQLGLDLSPSRRPLEYLVVDSAVQPKAW
jgi:uncharacterized protein (TIGR03435 family)